MRTYGLPDLGKYNEDNITMVFNFKNGSVGTIDYFANGDKSVPKERIEVFAGGKVVDFDDFRKISLIENGKKVIKKSFLKQDKGHQAAWQAFVNSIKDGSESPIRYEEIWQVTMASFAAVRSLRENTSIELIN